MTTSPFLFWRFRLFLFKVEAIHGKVEGHHRRKSGGAGITVLSSNCRGFILTTPSTATLGNSNARLTRVFSQRYIRDLAYNGAAVLINQNPNQHPCLGNVAFVIISTVGLRFCTFSS
ncbi:uncharacterized protein FPRO_13852 [Fusarium proliferatum ET1]|uniref:Secreted protein n=1 Tax=Fusarium proliferatum (strain ET1) TaxID=1227346 RepID=A0A1L7VUI4_FUSPR|nr:uncharacterized protein FPRO_13852 [Fusarium proliferatum ET1]CZR44048.1 uncharacterized protein FPRO_13852 [Fusarium proliferatum ET1]